MSCVNEPQWFAIYTQSRAEQKAARELEKNGIAHYLPMMWTIRQWSDRKKKIRLPMIRSYLFVHIVEKQYHVVRDTPGVVNFVYFSGKPVPIPAWQITNLRILEGTEQPVTTETHAFTQGEEVQIVHGPLTGLRGTIQHTRNGHKLWINIEGLQYHLTVDIELGYVERIGDSEQ